MFQDWKNPLCRDRGTKRDIVERMQTYDAKIKRSFVKCTELEISLRFNSANRAVLSSDARPGTPDIKFNERPRCINLLVSQLLSTACAELPFRKEKTILTSERRPRPKRNTSPREKHFLTIPRTKETYRVIKSSGTPCIRLHLDCGGRCSENTLLEGTD